MRQKTITYETADCQGKTIRRERVITSGDSDMVVAFNEDGDSAVDRVRIPIYRVVRIDG